MGQPVYSRGYVLPEVVFCKAESVLFTSDVRLSFFTLTCLQFRETANVNLVNNINNARWF